MGESTTRSQSPYDPAIHTMEEVDVPTSSLVHGEPALSGGVGVGGWAPLDDGEGMRVEAVTDMAGAGDGALSGVGGLGSGHQVSLQEVGAEAGQSEVVGAWARGRADHNETMHLTGDTVEPGAAGGLRDAAGLPSGAATGMYKSAKARKNALNTQRRCLRPP